MIQRKFFSRIWERYPHLRKYFTVVHADLTEIYAGDVRSPTAGIGTELLDHREKRYAGAQLSKAKFQEQLVSNALLAPREILDNHPADQMSEFRRNRWPAGLTSPKPQKLEDLAVPIDEVLGVTTVSALCQLNHRMSHRRVKRVG